MAYEMGTINTVQIARDIKSLVDFTMQRGKTAFYFYVSAPDCFSSQEKNKGIDDLFKLLSRMCQMHTGQQPKMMSYSAGCMCVNLHRQISPAMSRNKEKMMFFSGEIQLEVNGGKR